MKRLKVQSPKVYVYNDEKDEEWWYVDKEDLIIKSDKINQVSYLEKVGRAIRCPFESELFSYAELVKAFKEETGIKILEGKVGAYLRAMGLYERFVSFRWEFIGEKFQNWCKENDIVIK